MVCAAKVLGTARVSCVAALIENWGRTPTNNLIFYIEVWLSLVERCVRDAEAVGSSPVTSTNLLKVLALLQALSFYFTDSKGLEPPVPSLLRYPTLRTLGARRNRRPQRFLLLAESPTGCARNVTRHLDQSMTSTRKLHVEVIF